MRPFAMLFAMLAGMVLAAPSAGADPARQFASQSPSGEFAGWKSYQAKPGATTADVWKLAADGVLACRGRPLGYLFTERDYTNFTLKLEWRWPGQPGKGGVLMRKTGPDKIWPKSLEAQINAGDAGDFWGLGGYTLSGPVERFKELQHPEFGKLMNLKKTDLVERAAGQWNQYEIRAQGETVILLVNGRQVNQAAGCAAVAGKICLTAEGTEIEFRNVTIEAARP